MTSEVSVTFGADPEYVIYGEKARSKKENPSGPPETVTVPVPSCGLVGGAKARPLKVVGQSGASVLEDNVAVEINIPICHSPLELVNTVASCYKDVLAHVQRAMANTRRTSMYKNITLVGVAGQHFPISVLKRFPQAMEFGCDPEYDAYGMDNTPIRVDTEDALFRYNRTSLRRFFGGHIHIGYTRSDIPERVVAQLCDATVGLATLHLDRQGKRRGLYGSAGRFRPKPYGIEYRTLSSFWANPRFIESDGCKVFIRQLENLTKILKSPLGTIQKVYTELPMDRIRTRINTEVFDLELVNHVAEVVRTRVGTHDKV